MRETPIVTTGCTGSQAHLLTVLRADVMLLCTTARDFTLQCARIFAQFWPQAQLEPIAGFIGRERQIHAQRLKDQLQPPPQGVSEMEQILKNEIPIGEEFYVQLLDYYNLYRLLIRYMDAFKWYDVYLGIRIKADY